MNNAVEISAPLKRNIEPGVKYDNLLPDVSCEAHNLGDGSNNTIEGVEFMANWIEKYAFQTTKLTEKLLHEGKVSRDDLGKTAQGIYNFLYHHIQYTADGELQQLRSPACAWQQRYQGVDCKSYTIFAMSILQNLGITAAIRQVKQPGFYPEQFTHVYVVIPVNQSVKSKITGKYHVVDATKHHNVEGDFLVKRDRIMSGLKYQGLNAPVESDKANLIRKNFDDFSRILVEDKKMNEVTVNEMREEVNKYTSNGHNPVFRITKSGVVVGSKLFPFIQGSVGLSGGSGSKIDFSKLIDSIAGVFSNIFDTPIDCWGGSAYSGDRLKNDLTILKKVVRGYTEQFNDAIRNENYQVAGYVYGFLRGKIKVANKTFKAKKAENDWNSCTSKNLDTIIEVSEKLKTKLYNDVENYISKYFDISKKGKLTLSNLGSSSPSGVIIDDMWAGHVRPVQEVTEYWYKLSPKTSDVPLLDVGDLDSQINNGTGSSGESNGGFDLGNIFGKGGVVKVPGFNPGGGKTVVMTPGQKHDYKNNTSKAGMGWLFPALLLGGSIMWISKNSRPNKPTRKRRAKKALKSKKSK